MIVIGRMAGNIESIEEWLERGHNQMNSGNYDEAIKCFDQALVIDPKNAIAWNNKGASLSNSGKHEEAIKCFDIALAIDLIMLVRGITEQVPMLNRVDRKSVV